MIPVQTNTPLQWQFQRQNEKQREHITHIEINIFQFWTDMEKYGCQTVLCLICHLNANEEIKFWKYKYRLLLPTRGIHIMKEAE